MKLLRTSDGSSNFAFKGENFSKNKMIRLRAVSDELLTMFVKIGDFPVKILILEKFNFQVSWI